MKAKKIVMVVVIILSFIVFLTMIATLAFQVKEIEIVKTAPFDVLNEGQISSYLDFIEGEKIVFLKKDELALQLKKEFPALKVIGIERVFPSTVVFYLSERIKVFCVKSGNEFVFFDRDGFYLGNNVANEGGGEGENIFACVEVTGFELPAGVSFQLGQLPAFSGDAKNKLDILSTFFNTLSLIGEEGYSDKEIKQFITSIEFLPGETILVQTRSGVKMQIEAAGDNLVKKVQAGMAAFINGNLENFDIANGTIFVTKNCEMSYSS